MDNPLHARFYADDVGQYRTQVQTRITLAKDTYLVRLECPELAGRITPGQFVMLRAPVGADPILGRAFAMYDVLHDAAGKPFAIDIVFHVVGKLTGLLAEVTAGDELVVWGPLGNGFAGCAAKSRSGDKPKHLIMVAGGIGQTPFLALAKESLGIQTYGGRKVDLLSKVSLCYGARSAEHLAGVADFEAAGVDVHIATDDGSAGYHGLVTELLAQVVSEFANPEHSDVHLVCCGPEPMMAAVASFAMKKNLPCQVSLETPMACGLGICFSCVTRVKQADGSWDFKRTCVDGPVFQADQLVW